MGALTLRPGDQLGPYEILAPIGAGGMGEVYRARDGRLQREVAVKVLPAAAASAAEARERMRREARAIAALQHPCICALHDIGESGDGRLYLVMELLQGRTLQARLEQGPLALPELLSLAADLADALETAHAAGIIHRDIKPANVMLTARGPKVLDFGLAQVSPEAGAATRTHGALTVPGEVIGTLVYMSPEQLRGEPLDARTDLFSLGLVIFEMATGRPAFVGRTAASIAASILHETPPRARTLRPDLPDGLDALLVKALEKDRTLRYQSASDLLVDLRRLQKPQPDGSGAADRHAPPKPAIVRRAAPAVGVAAIVVAVAAYWLPREAPARTLTDKDTIVLADFQNCTGDPVFDDTLRQGMAAQLVQSPFLSLVPDERLRRTMALMGQPADAPLTVAIAREVCERLGSRVVLEGSIAPLGSQYVLGLRATECVSGEVIDTQQVQAARKEDVLTVLGDIAETFRRRVGESAVTISRHSVPLQEATTRSLEALKAYSTGWRMNFAEGSTALIPQVRRAVEIDPQFAAAHAQLGLSYSNLGEQNLAQEYTRKAYALRDRTSDRERFWITFLFARQVTGNLQKAWETLQLWSDTYPRDSEPLGLQSGFSAFGTGSYERAIAAADRVVELDPDVSYAYSGKALALIILNRGADAEAALDRGGDRLRDFFPAWEGRFHLAFLRGDAAGMRRWVERAAGRPGEQGALIYLSALVSARAGRLREAGELSRVTENIARQAGLAERAATFAAGQAVWEALYGRPDHARRLAREALALSRGRDLQYGAAFALALTGDWPPVRSVVDDLAARFPEDTSVQFTYLPTLRALLALERGSPEEALAALQPARRYEHAVSGLPFNAYYGSMYSTYVRGQACLAAGRAGDAAAEFGKIIDARGLVREDPIGVVARLQRARALARAGDVTEASAAYEDVLGIWAEADPDVPLVVAARAERAR